MMSVKPHSFYHMFELWVGFFGLKKESDAGMRSSGCALT